MPTYLITSKDGKRYKVTGPSKEGALKALKTQLANAEIKPNPAKVDPDTMQPAGVPEFKPVGVEGYDPKTGTVGHDRTSQLGAFSTAAVDAVPIVGPTLTKATNAAAAGIVTPFSDQSFAENYKEMGGYGARAQEDNPGYALGGRIAGTVAPMVGVGATVMGAKVLGEGAGSLITNSLASAGSNAAISGADTAARGGDLRETLKSGAIGGTLGAIIPGAGAALKWAGGAVKNVLAPRVNSVLNTGAEAERRVGAAYNIDRANADAPVLGATDEAAASANGQTLLNVDRGGETTRALTRAVANVDPEARGLIDRTVKDRFASQGERAQSFIDRISGGTADSQAMQETITAAARKANPVAYGKAFNAKSAQNMDSPGLLGLLASPAIRDAAKAAETRGANRAVVEGFSPVKNPFVIDDAGTVALRDPKVKPTLQFWDQVKRNLDAEIGKASRSGDKTLTADLTQLKGKLVSELDAAVPEYKAARQGAAAFFDAEDALDAGRKFVTQKRDIEGSKKALSSMTPTERLNFAVGFASELKASIKNTNDSVNVTKKLFGSEGAREKIRLALGPKNYREFEQFVKVETTTDMLRGAMGNSTTARQLAEIGLAVGRSGAVSGIAGGAGTFTLTGDWKKSLGAGIVAGVLRKYGVRVDDRMTKQMARLLLSEDQTALQRASVMAANNPEASAAVEAIQTVIGGILRGAGTEVARPNAPGPADITATRPTMIGDRPNLAPAH